MINLSFKADTDGTRGPRLTQGKSSLLKRAPSGNSFRSEKF